MVPRQTMVHDDVPLVGFCTTAVNLTTPADWRIITKPEAQPREVGLVH